MAGEASVVAIDWGTSSFRLWVLDERDTVLAESRGPYGMGSLGPGDYAGVLDGELARLGVGERVPVVVSGMAGAAQGWFEAPYLPLETDLGRLGAHAVRVDGLEREVHILPGLRQDEPANVMRGEETQIAGFLADTPGFDGTLCLPGTHTKWVRLERGVVREFTTVMTGEQFALLSAHSVLRHSLAAEGWDEEAFATAVGEMRDEPLRLASALFELRAEGLLHARPGALARARLSGLLIGFELAAVSDYWSASEPCLIGDATLCARYRVALALRDRPASVRDATTLTVAGLAAARRSLEAAP